MDLAKKVDNYTKMLQHHMEQQHLFLGFSNDFFKWHKRTSELKKFKKALPCPQFHEEVLVLFEAPKSVPDEQNARPSLSSRSVNNNAISSDWSHLLHPENHHHPQLNQLVLRRERRKWLMKLQTPLSNQFKKG